MTLPEKSEDLKDLVIDAFDNIKGIEIVTLDVEKKTDIADFMVVVTGTTNRQVKALTDSVVVNAKKAGYIVKGVEGDDNAEWVLVDLGDVICHIMLPKVRQFYELERLWSIGPEKGSDGLAEN